MNQSPKLSVSIVIATANRPRPVLDCVTSFSNQVPREVELIVVDAGREEMVDEAALKALWPNSTVVRMAERNASAQRNAGVRQATGDVIVFLDDDAVVNANWWPLLLEPLADPAVAVVQGGIHSSRPPVRLRSDRGGFVKWSGFTVACLNRGPDAPRELDWPMTTNMALRKSAYQAVGGLEPAFVIYDEDVDFGLRLRRAGWRIVYEPSASVYHYGHRMWRPPATKQHAFRKGRNHTLMLVRNYGIWGRVWIYLLCAPWVVMWTAAVEVARYAWRTFGHAAAFCLGTLKGVHMGIMQARRGRDQ